MLEPPPGADRPRCASTPRGCRARCCTARRPLRGGRVARGAGPVRAHAERVLRGAAPAFPACSACTTWTPRSRAARRASAGAAAAPGCASTTARPRCAPSSGACSRSPTACCASPRRTPPAVSAPAGARCSRPTASTTSSSSRRRPDCRRARAVLRPLRLRGEPARRRALPRRGLAARAAARARARGWRSRAAGWTRRCATRLEAVDGVEVLGLVADLPGVLGRRARGRRPDLGGRRHAAEGARGAGRGTRRGRRRRSAPRGSASSDGRHGVLGEHPEELRGRARGPCSPTRSGRRRWAPRGASWPSASAGRTRSPAPRRCTRRSSPVSAPTIDWSSRADADHRRGAPRPQRQRQTRRKAGTQSHGTRQGRPGCRKGQSGEVRTMAFAAAGDADARAGRGAGRAGRRPLPLRDRHAPPATPTTRRPPARNDVVILQELPGAADAAPEGRQPEAQGPDLQEPLGHGRARPVGRRRRRRRDPGRRRAPRVVPAEHQRPALHVPPLQTGSGPPTSATPAYQQQWADNVLAEIAAKGWDGVFMDDTNPSMECHYDVDRVAQVPDRRRLAGGDRLGAGRDRRALPRRGQARHPELRLLEGVPGRHQATGCATSTAA